MKNEKAIAVAKDVLANLQNLHLKNGYYFNVVAGDTIFKLDESLNDYADKIQPSCNVCLLGACLLSKSRLYKDVPLSVIFKLVKYGNKYDIANGLNDVFSYEQLSLIENAFELTIQWSLFVYPESRAAVAFGEKYKTKYERVEAVMKNIIANDGHFVPKEKEKEESTNV